MGTYTTNYNLFMPTVGETGWGEIVNGNFTTIDSAMKGLDTRIDVIESVIHVDENQNVTFPANITALSLTTNTLNLPVGTTGNFTIGKVSFTDSSFWTGQHTISSMETYTYPALTMVSTIPNVFNVSLDGISPTVSYIAPPINVGVTYRFYQNDTLIHTTSAQTGTLTLNDLSAPVKVTVTPSTTGTMSNYTSKLTKSAINYYLL